MTHVCSQHVIIEVFRAMVCVQLWKASCVDLKETSQMRR